MDPLPLDLEPLVQHHGAALRRLAHELVRDRAGADDAVQETWLRVLRRPPRHDAQLGGWLATILRHVVARSNRAERRRQRHELAAARPGATPDHAEVAARSDLAQRLLAIVHALDAPYRAAIWQRYFEGLPPREIARRCGEPLTTVKSRLQRGLQQLRERLGEGGESDWRGALGSAFGFDNGAATAATVAAWHGGLLMATWTKVAAAAVVAIAAVWWWWPAEVARQFGARATPAAVNPVSGVTPHDPSTQRELASATADRALALPEEQETRFVRVRGRVVDADTKQALPDVRILLGPSGKQWPDATAAASVTRADGRFEVDYDAARLPRLWLTHPEHVSIWSEIGDLEAGQIEDFGDVPLVRGRRLSGRVVDVRGVPLPSEAVVSASWPWSGLGHWSSSSLNRARTRADGSFEFEDPVRLGPVTWDVYSDDYELADVRHEIVTHDSPNEVVLSMRERQQITGTVVDSSGQALAGIGLSCVPGLVQTRSKGDGSFCLRKRFRNALTSTQVHVVDAPDFNPPPEDEVRWGTNGLRVVLVPAATLPLEVVDSDGTPISGFAVVLWRRGLDPGEEGTVRQRGLHDAGRLQVERVLPGRTTLRILPVDPMLAPSDKVPVTSLAPMRIVLVRRVPCTVEVLENGRPRIGASVELVRDGGRYAAWYGTRSLPRMPEPRIDPHTADRSTDHVERVAGGTTTADGTVRLVRDPVVAGCTLLVQAIGRPVHFVFEPVFPPDDRPLRVELTPYGEVAGHVDLHDHARFDVQVVFRCGERSESVRPQPDGSYRSPQLPVGPCTVELRFGEGAAKEVVAQGVRQVQVLLDATVVVDFDLADSAMASVRGAVVGAIGDRRLSVDFVRQDNKTPTVLANAVVGAGGTFGPVDLVPGTYRFALRELEAARWDVTGLAADTFEVGAGEQRWIDVPAPRRLVVHLRRPDGSVVRGESVVARCGGLQFPSFTMFIRPVDEQIVLDPAPALPVEFRNSAHDAPWSTPVVMPPDRSEAEVTVVLPDAPL